jgi:hypothetical protein
MTLTIYKIYNRVVHSYLAVLETAPGGDEDPAIFVCKDLPHNAPIPPAPPQDSSSIDEGPSSSPGPDAESSGPSLESSPEPGAESSITEEISSPLSEESSPVEISSVVEEISSAVEEESSPEEATSLNGDSSNLPSDISSTEGGSEASTGESSAESSEPLFVVFPQRTLVSIASLTDLMVLPLVPAALGDLYRASTVAMIFRSQAHMNDVLAEVISEVRTNAVLQRMPIESVETVVLQDPVYGQDDDKLFYFR